MRSIGAAIFGHIGDKYRKMIALLLSTVLMTMSTLFVAFVPGYQNIGVFESVLVVCLRLSKVYPLWEEAGKTAIKLRKDASR